MSKMGRQLKLPNSLKRAYLLEYSFILITKKNIFGIRSNQDHNCYYYYPNDNNIMNKKHIKVKNNLSDHNYKKNCIKLKKKYDNCN